MRAADCVCIVIVVVASSTAAAAALCCTMWRMLDIWPDICLFHVISQCKRQADILPSWILWPGKQLHAASMCLLSRSLSLSRSLYLHLFLCLLFSLWQWRHEFGSAALYGAAWLPFGQSLGCLHFLRHFIWKQLSHLTFYRAKEESSNSSRRQQAAAAAAEADRNVDT